LAGLSHDAVFDVFDEDGSGGVDYFEFVVVRLLLRFTSLLTAQKINFNYLVIRQTLTAFRAPHEVQSLDPQFIFDMLDLNSDQRVTFSEIKAVLGVLMNSQEIADSDLLHLFDVMDNDQGGDVSIQGDSFPLKRTSFYVSYFLMLTQHPPSNTQSFAPSLSTIRPSTAAGALSAGPFPGFTLPSVPSPLPLHTILSRMLSTLQSDLPDLALAAHRRHHLLN